MARMGVILAQAAGRRVNYTTRQLVLRANGFDCDDTVGRPEAKRRDYYVELDCLSTRTKRQRKAILRIPVDGGWAL